jgi:hypothetical protein
MWQTFALFVEYSSEASGKEVEVFLFFLFCFDNDGTKE